MRSIINRIILGSFIIFLFGQDPDNIITNNNSFVYIVQISAWVKHSDALDEVKKLEKLGYNPYIEEYSSTKKILWRVRIGPFDDRSSAILLSEKIFKDFSIKTWIVSAQGQKKIVKEKPVISNSPVMVDTVASKPEVEEKPVISDSPVMVDMVASKADVEEKPVISD